jgi:hypothetical protein
LFLIIVSVYIRTSEGGRGLTSNFLCGGGMDEGRYDGRYDEPRRLKTAPEIRQRSHYARSELMRAEFMCVHTRLLARILKEGVQFWYNNTSTVKRGVEKTFLWKTFEVYVTSCQYLFQSRSTFFKHTLLCEFVPLCFFT